MKLLITSLQKELPTLQKNNIRLSAIGNIELLPASAQKQLLEVIDNTKENSQMTLNNFLRRLAA